MEKLKEAFTDHIEEPINAWLAEIALMSTLLEGRCFNTSQELRVFANLGRDKYGNIDTANLIEYFFGEAWERVQKVAYALNAEYPIYPDGDPVAFRLALRPRLSFSTFLDERMKALDWESTAQAIREHLAEEEREEVDDDYEFDQWVHDYIDDSGAYEEYLDAEGYEDDEEADEDGGFTLSEYIDHHREDFRGDWYDSDDYQRALETSVEERLSEIDWEMGHGPDTDIYEIYNEILRELFLYSSFREEQDVGLVAISESFKAQMEPKVILKSVSGEWGELGWSELYAGEEIDFSGDEFCVVGFKFPFGELKDVCHFNFGLTGWCVWPTPVDAAPILRELVSTLDSLTYQMESSLLRVPKDPKPAVDILSKEAKLLPLYINFSFSVERILDFVDFKESEAEAQVVDLLEDYFIEDLTVTYGFKEQEVSKSDRDIHLRFRHNTRGALTLILPLSLALPKILVESENEQKLRVEFKVLKDNERVDNLYREIKYTCPFNASVDITSEGRNRVAVQVEADEVVIRDRNVYIYVDTVDWLDTLKNKIFNDFRGGEYIRVACSLDFAIARMSGMPKSSFGKGRWDVWLVDYPTPINGTYILDERLWENTVSVSQPNFHPVARILEISEKTFPGMRIAQALPQFQSRAAKHELEKVNAVLSNPKNQFPNVFGLIGAKKWRFNDKIDKVDVLFNKNTNFIAQSLLWLWYPHVITRFGEHGLNLDKLLVAPLGTVMDTLSNVDGISPQDFMKSLTGPNSVNLPYNKHTFPPYSNKLPSEDPNYFLLQSLMRFIYSFSDFYTKPLAILHNFLTIDKSMNEHRSNPLLKDKFGIASSISIKEPTKNWLRTYREALSASQKDTSWSILMVKDDWVMADLEKEIDLWEEHARVFEWEEFVKLNNDWADHQGAHWIWEQVPEEFGEEASLFNELAYQEPIAFEATERINYNSPASSRFVTRFGSQDNSEFSHQLNTSLWFICRFWTFKVNTMLIDKAFLESDFYLSYVKGDNPSVMHVLDLGYLLKYPTWGNAINKLSKNRTVSVGDGEKAPISVANLEKNLMAYALIREALTSASRTKSNLGPFPNEQGDKATQQERLSLTAFHRIFTVMNVAFRAYTKHDTGDIENTFGPPILTSDSQVAIQVTGFKPLRGKQLLGITSTRISEPKSILKKRFAPLTNVYHTCIALKEANYIDKAMRSENTQVLTFFNLNVADTSKNLTAIVFYTRDRLKEAKSYSNHVIGYSQDKVAEAHNTHFILNSLLFMRNVAPAIYATTFSRLDDLRAPARRYLPTFAEWCAESGVTKATYAQDIGLADKLQRAVASVARTLYLHKGTSQDNKNLQVLIETLCLEFGDTLDCNTFHIRNGDVYEGVSEDFEEGNPIADVRRLANLLIEQFVDNPDITWDKKLEVLGIKHNDTPKEYLAPLTPDLLPPLFLPYLWEQLNSQKEQFYIDFIRKHNTIASIITPKEYAALLELEAKPVHDDTEGFKRRLEELEANSRRTMRTELFTLSMLEFAPKKPLIPVK